MSSLHAQSSSDLPRVAAPTFSFDCPESWSCFEERLEFFFEAQRITDAVQRRAVFLTSVCNRTYELLRPLAQPSKVNTLTYSQLVDLLRNRFDPRPNEILQRYHFHCRVQKDGESVNDFVAELRRLSAKCDFGHMDEMLRDRLVCGIRDEAVQIRLFAERHLDFATAFSLAQAFKSARNDVCVIRNADRMHVNIEKLPVSSQARTVRKQFSAQDMTDRCSRCGDSKHQKDECPSHRARCQFCRRIGHIERACLSKEDAQAHMVREETDVASPGSEDSGGVIPLYNVRPHTRAYPPPKVISLRVDGIPLCMEINSGASRSIISERTFQNVLLGQPQITRVSLSRRTWSEATIAFVGMATVTMTYKDKKHRLHLLVAQLAGPSLLDRDWFEPLGISVICKLQVASLLSLGGSVKTEIPDVFQEGLETFTRSGKQMGGADAIIRLPLPYNEIEMELQPPEVFLLEIEPHRHFSPADIAQATDNDPTLAHERAWISNG